MSGRAIKTPGPEHPITIEPSPQRITVSAGGAVIADTTAALILREGGYKPVTYVPRGDVDLSLLERTELSTYCPYKGDCSYYSIPSAGARAVNAIWSYEQPYEAVAKIKDYMAFYPDRVDSIETR
ncbi:DUF427 domain-containing protein [Rhodoligotrophos appendicifer]|uniref:DUF427 domain-containing protein n=1 Tax=Rhodoligotrophos appendicifer TaxID=987056 RepID=UPI00196160BC|nr:DUF427 domain-containing protein [Rhodoligotrophos appendicifer]